jgi:hypothetical protein
MRPPTQSSQDGESRWALAFVRNSDGRLKVLEEILHLISDQGIEIKCLYLDRAFFTADIVHYLQERSI